MFLGFSLYALLLFGSCAATFVGIVVTIRIIRRRREARRLQRLRKPRNSLHKYPSFVANKITGVITILPQQYNVKEGALMMGQHYLIAVGPPIEFYMSNLSYYDRMYPGKAVRLQDEDSDTDMNNNVMFYNNEDEEENNNEKDFKNNNL